MSVLAGFAAIILAHQGTKEVTLDQKIATLRSDLMQTLTLFDSLKTKVKTPDEAKTLVKNYFTKLESIADTSDRYLLVAKDDNQRAKTAMIKFESLSNTDRSAAEVEKMAVDIANKYKDSETLCEPLENLTFYQYLGAERYSAFDTAIGQTKNLEVKASSLLASCFVQFLTDAGDVNKFRALSIQYEKTRAGQRAARIYDYRTKLVLGKPMLDVDLNLLNGTNLNVNSLKGKVVVIDFWGFWCQPCLAELSDIKDYVSKNPTRLAWFGVNTDNWTTSFVSQRIKDQGITWPNVAAGSPSGRLPLDLGITVYPSKIIIDPAGIVRYVPSARNWREVLDELLK